MFVALRGGSPGQSAKVTGLLVTFHPDFAPPRSPRPSLARLIEQLIECFSEAGAKHFDVRQCVTVGGDAVIDAAVVRRHPNRQGKPWEQRRDWVGLDHLGVLFIPDVADAFEKEQRQDVTLPVRTVDRAAAQDIGRFPEVGFELAECQ